MIREVLALAVVAKAAKISSMVDSCGSANSYDGVLVRYLGLVWLTVLQKNTFILQPLGGPELPGYQSTLYIFHLLPWGKKFYGFIE